MATRSMLIDASHPEETRVVVVDGSRVEDYDVEVASRRQLKGNIYLAKVTRVEPSLQAAFVDYGGNRHGFLAFNEIHPDYYQIPVADRERLIAEQTAADNADRDDDEDDEDEDIERRRTRPISSRYYKIQEVIKRRQIMLVQVAKEERGTKGAALTTYLSLAGRYCVLMPNTSRGGGISRKIAGATDRKRLKKILSELEVPEGMAVIVRTAGAGRGKAEIKRDYEYLVRLWSNIRETTLQSTAPTLVYEEASLIKRSIRDLYGRDIEEIVVQGEEEYRVAKEFMKLFISSHAKRVKLYEEGERALFQSYGVEEQLDSMHSPTVQLRSGGYVVINPTEALVAIDVNSGRSTRERNIEETALRTNMEAADEIARQLRLRDLAGLVVIDFIDMENPRNQGMVERRMKEAMKNDRARIQLGRISAFGLMELSRQRLRPSLIETSFEMCSSCSGMGMRRTTESTALAILRKLEEEGHKHRASEVAVATPPTVALYLLNQKRRSLLAIEERYGMAVAVMQDDSLVPPEHRVERLKPYGVRPAEEVAEVEEVAEPEEAIEEAAGEALAADGEDGGARRGRRRRPRRRRRGEGEAAVVAGVDADAEALPDAHDGDDADDADDADEHIDATEAGEPVAAEGEDVAHDDQDGTGEQQPGRRRRRRGKRGGRRRARTGSGEHGELDQPELAAESDEHEDGEPLDSDESAYEAEDLGAREFGDDEGEDEHEDRGEDLPVVAGAPPLLGEADADGLEPSLDERADEEGVSAADEVPAEPARRRRRSSRRRTGPRADATPNTEQETSDAGLEAEPDLDVSSATFVDGDREDFDDRSLDEDALSEVGGARPALELEDELHASAEDEEDDRDDSDVDADRAEDEHDDGEEEEIVVVGGAYVPIDDEEAPSAFDEAVPEAVGGVDAVISEALPAVDAVASEPVPEPAAETSFQPAAETRAEAPVDSPMAEALEERPVAEMSAEMPVETLATWIAPEEGGSVAAPSEALIHVAVEEPGAMPAPAPDTDIDPEAEGDRPAEAPVGLDSLPPVAEVEVERSEEEVAAALREQAERDAEAERVAEAARRTEIVHVGEGSEHAEDDSRRRGWWQRILT